MNSSINWFSEWNASNLSSLYAVDANLVSCSFFRLGAVMCMGVTAGAYILTLFAVCSLLECYNIFKFTPTFFTDQGFELQMKYRQRVLGLILVSPLCKTPSWTEWLYNKVISANPSIILLRRFPIIFISMFEFIYIFQVMSNLLYFYGMCGLLKEFLLQRYFSKVL